MSDLSKKRVLILGAGRGQMGLYKGARELGITTIGATLLDKVPYCMHLADEICEANIMNPDEVEEKSRNIDFDGVATCCLDKGLKALGRLCDRRNLIGYSEESAELCNDKLRMKQRFNDYGVSTAPFELIKTRDDIDKIIESLGGYPVIVKATDLAGSRGIYIARNRVEATLGFDCAMEETSKDYLIIEKFIEGKEFGAQAFIQNGKILFILPHGDILYSAKTNVPIGHYVPYTVDPELNDKISKTASLAIRSMGLDNCAVNLDFIEKDGEVYVLELSGRIGANGLPEVVSGYYNIDYYKMVLLASLGVDVEPLWNSRRVDGAVMSRMIFSGHKSGVLKQVRHDSTDNEAIIGLQIFLKEGDNVHEFENSSHCVGQLTVKAPTVQDCKNISDEFINNIDIDLM